MTTTAQPPDAEAILTAMAEAFEGYLVRLPPKRATPTPDPPKPSGTLHLHDGAGRYTRVDPTDTGALRAALLDGYWPTHYLFDCTHQVVTAHALQGFRCVSEQPLHELWRMDPPDGSWPVFVLKRRFQVPHGVPFAVPR